MAMENYSLSDIAAVNGGTGGFGGSSPWVLIILFALIFGWGGNGFGNRGGELNQYATAASQQEILFGQQFQALDNKIDRIGNGIADATFALNNSITGEGRALQAQIADCCCATQRNTDALRYDMALGNCAIKEAIHAEGEATRALLQQNKIEALQGQISQLQLAQAVSGVVRYPNGMTYSAGSSPFCACGGASF